MTTKDWSNFKSARETSFFVAWLCAPCRRQGRAALPACLQTQQAVGWQGIGGQWGKGPTPAAVPPLLCVKLIWPASASRAAVCGSEHEQRGQAGRAGRSAHTGGASSSGRGTSLQHGGPAACLCGKDGWLAAGLAVQHSARAASHQQQQPQGCPEDSCCHGQGGVAGRGRLLSEVLEVAELLRCYVGCIMHTASYAAGVKGCPGTTCRGDSAAARRCPSPARLSSSRAG